MGCRFCQRIIHNKGSLAAHEKCCKMNPGRTPHTRSPRAGAQPGQIPWNKGLTKETSDSVLKAAKAQIGKPSNRTGCVHSPESRQKMSLSAKARGIGGYKKGSGWGRSGWYNGIWCDSSWELAFVLYCQDKEIPLERSKEKRTYSFQGTVKNYFPDFLIGGEKIVEIKGWITDQSEAKKMANPDVEILGKPEMAPILEYVVRKYGKDFTSLYEQ